MPEIKDIIDALNRIAAAIEALDQPKVTINTSPSNGPEHVHAYSDWTTSLRAVGEYRQCATCGQYDYA